MSIVTLFHGSDHIIKKPELRLGKETNDYGQGFYCTELPEMAKEWACKENKDGYLNEYRLDTSGLKTLNLLDGNYSVINWIALLLKYRVFSLQDEISIQAREYIIEHYSIDLKDVDIIVGYRADDSYFSYAQSFVSNTLPVRSLGKALVLGKLGKQTVLVSEKAFNQIEYVGAETADKKVYYPRFEARDSKARKDYRNEVKKSKALLDDIFVIDIIREGIQNDDPRIQRIVLG